MSQANDKPAVAPKPSPTVEVEPGVARPAAVQLPRDELNTLAEDYGLDPTCFESRTQVLEALSARRRLISSLDRGAMLEVVRWGRRPVAADATREQLALEIARIRRMSFDGLSREALLVLARLRGIKCSDDAPAAELIRKLRRKEGLLSRFNRKRRSLIGAVASKVVGDESDEEPYRYLPSTDETTATPTSPAKPPAPTIAPARLREEIEERGLFGGLADRVRRSADTYVNQKLDEIEARIDRKLDEIDHRLQEWRDKEIANRIRIIKITLWASVIVSIISLIYAYLTRQVF